jgi:hypothetical protein
MSPFTYLKTVCLLGLYLGVAVPAVAQTDTDRTECGTGSLPPTERRALEAQAKLALQLKQASQQAAVNAISYVPIRPHIVRRADGTGGYSLQKMNAVMALTNSKFLASGIQFYFSGTAPSYIDNDALFATFTKSTSETALTGYLVNNAMNQVYVQSFGANSTLGGYAYYPFNALQSTLSVIKEGSTTDLGNRLVPHEVGHNFNLIHTQDYSSGFELVSGANCATAGDLVCDTPADPLDWPAYPGASSTCVSGCPSVFTCNFLESGTGATYAPSPTNIMSYYFPCTHEFTLGQNNRMVAALAVRQTHTAYSLTAVSTNVTPVSSLSVSMVNNRAVLTWTDNASNEMGYFIERSTTSATEGFLPIGGVASNATSFTDVAVPSNTLVHYRVRPSNSTGNVSAVVSFQAPICQPVFTNGCSQFLTGIGSVTLAGQALSQNSGCSPSAYGQFTAVAPLLTAGSSYTISLAPINTWNTIRYGVWADFDRNGSFGDPGERVFQSVGASTAVVSGTFTVPANLGAGRVPLRVVALSSTSTPPTNACGSYNWGEAEDYAFDVNPLCNLMISMQNSTWTNPATWSCNRVPVPLDPVTIGHTVNVPTTTPPNPINTNRGIRFAGPGKLVFGTGSTLKIN